MPTTQDFTLSNGSAAYSPQPLSDSKPLPHYLTGLLPYIQANRRLFIGLTLLLSVAFVTYAAIGYRPKYSSSATVVIRESAYRNKYVTDDERDTLSSSFTNPILNTMELLNTDAVVKPMWDYLHVEHLEDLKRAHAENLPEWFAYSNHGKRFLKIRNTPGTDMITIKLTWTDPVIARTSLEKVLEAFKNASLDLNQSEERDRSQFLDQQIQTVKDRLQKIRDQFSRYQTNKQTVDMSQENESFSKNRIDIESEMKDLLADAASKDSESAQYQKLLGMNSRQAIDATALGGNDTLVKLQAKRYELAQQYSVLKTHYTDEHIKVREVASQLAQVDKSIQEEIHRSIGNAKTDVKLSQLVADKPRQDAITSLMINQAQGKALKQKAAILHNYLNQINQRLSVMPDIEKNVANFKDQEIALSNSLQTLEEKSLEYKMREMQTMSNVFVVDPPSIPVKANFPSRPQLIILSLLAALIGSVTVMMLKQQSEVRAWKK